MTQPSTNAKKTAVLMTMPPFRYRFSRKETGYEVQKVEHMGCHSAPRRVCGGLLRRPPTGYSATVCYPDTESSREDDITIDIVDLEALSPDNLQGVRKPDGRIKAEITMSAAHSSLPAPSEWCAGLRRSVLN